MRRSALLCLSLLGGVLAGGPVRALDKDSKVTIKKSDFGKTDDGTPVELYTLTNSKGTVVKICTYGGIITEVQVPDKDGKMADVVLGFDDLKGYLKGNPFFGCITGRVANRIARGKFTLDGKEYTLATNNGPNHLHGGKVGFDKKVWSMEREFADPERAGILLAYTSKDGEEGYPGEMRAFVTYALSDSNELWIGYRATADRATPVNLTNHSYFNLAGHGSGTILDHELMLTAEKYTPVDKTLIPTGKIEPVKGTPLDFTKPTAIGKRFGELKTDPIGYDHNFVLRDGPAKEPQLAARVVEPKSGRVMEVLTREPGVQLYTGNFLDGSNKGKGGAVYVKHAGFCLETQHFPDSVNQPSFPSVILRPGKTYETTTIYRFSTK